MDPNTLNYPEEQWVIVRVVHLIDAGLTFTVEGDEYYNNHLATTLPEHQGPLIIERTLITMDTARLLACVMTAEGLFLTPGDEVMRRQVEEATERMSYKEGLLTRELSMSLGHEQLIGIWIDEDAAPSLLKIHLQYEKDGRTYWTSLQYRGNYLVEHFSVNPKE